MLFSIIKETDNCYKTSRAVIRI